MRLTETARSARRNFAFSRFSNFEKIVEIARRALAHFLHRQPAQLAQFPRRILHERRLVPLPTMRHRRQIWRVGLDEHPVKWNFQRRVANLLRLGESDVSRE